jgi:hypothetical protein
LGPVRTDKLLQKGWILVRPFLLYAIITFTIAFWGYTISGGYPWGVDDGVKRLMARSLVQSGGSSCLIAPSSEPDISDRCFPIPSPFVEPSGDGYRGIFPAFWPALASLFLALLGGYGFYLLAALVYTGTVYFAFRLLSFTQNRLHTFWAVAVIAFPLLFYGLTFWEHALSLLFLIPLFQGLLHSEKGNARWTYIGLAFGFSIYLRPETALFYPLLWVIKSGSLRAKTARLFRLSLGMALILLGAALFERIFTGRWWPAQISFNLGPGFQQAGFVERILKSLGLLFDSPLPAAVFISGVLAILFLAIILKKPLISAVGLSVLALAGTVRGYFDYSAFALTASSQGLFFAFPWLGLCFFRKGAGKWYEQPFFILGWGYLALAVVLGPDQAGMHWGPRFLFPALIPLVMHIVVSFKDWSRATITWAMLCTGTAIAVNAAVSVDALALRGHATSKVAAAVLQTGNRMLLVDRWHQGADLEPLWTDHTLFWFEGQGELEELLLNLQHGRPTESIDWIKSGMEYDLSQIPVAVLEREKLPERAGWTGELVEVRLEDEDHMSWGTVYWHAARRRAEAGRLTEALQLFEHSITIFPGNADLHYDYSLCLGKLGLTQRALQELEETLRLDPGHEAATALWRQLGRP